MLTDGRLDYLQQQLREGQIVHPSAILDLIAEVRRLKAAPYAPLLPCAESSPEVHESNEGHS